MLNVAVVDPGLAHQDGVGTCAIAINHNAFIVVVLHGRCNAARLSILFQQHVFIFSTFAVKFRQTRHFYSPRRIFCNGQRRSVRKRFINRFYISINAKANIFFCNAITAHPIEDKSACMRLHTIFPFLFYLIVEGVGDGIGNGCAADAICISGCLRCACIGNVTPCLFEGKGARVTAYI